MGNEGDHIRSKNIPGFPPGTCDLYRAAFEGSPWDEGRKCDTCGGTSATLDSKICCGKPMRFYWTDEAITNALEASATDRLLVFHVEDNMAIGLAAAQVMTMQKLRAHLQVGNCFMPEILEDARIIYLADMAVTPERQGNKIGSWLFDARQTRIEELRYGELPQFVRVRRAPVPSLTFTWYVKRKSKAVVYEYPEDDGRVVVQMR